MNYKYCFIRDTKKILSSFMPFMDLLIIFILLMFSCSAEGLLGSQDTQRERSLYRETTSRGFVTFQPEGLIEYSDKWENFFNRYGILDFP